MQRQYVYLDAAFGEPVCPSNGMNTVAGAQQRYPAGMASDSRVIWIVHTGTYKPARKTSWLCNVRAMGKATCYRNESSRRNVCLKRSDTNMPSTLRRCRAHTFGSIKLRHWPGFFVAQGQDTVAPTADSHVRPRHIDGRARPWWPGRPRLPC